MEIVNPVDSTEMDGWARTLLTTFLAPADDARAAESAQSWADRLEPERTWGARDRGRWVATLATDARTITVPAPSGTTVLDVDALTGVTVNATHRRRGLLSGMLTAALHAAKERGDVASYLVAAEWPIYGRFGYGPATRVAEYTLHSRSPGATVPADGGHVRQVDPAEWAKVAPAVFELARQRRAGEIDRNERHWSVTEQVTARKGHQNRFVHESPAGVVDGLLQWEPTREIHLGVSQGAIAVTDLQAATPEAYRGLWSYLLGIDLVSAITIGSGAVDEQLRFLLRDGRTLQATFVGDFTWVALLDVPGALTARGYRSTGRLVLDVVDDTATGFAGGRFLLDVSPEGASCTPTTQSADLTVPIQALGSAYLGDFGLTVTGLADEHTPGAIATFDLLFGTALAPKCSTGF